MGCTQSSKKQTQKWHKKTKVQQRKTLEPSSPFCVRAKEGKLGRLRWKEEKACILAELNKYKKLCTTQTDNLKEAHQNYEQDKATHLQTIQDLKSSLHRKEQEWESTENSLKAQLEQQRAETRKMEAELRKAESLKNANLCLQKEKASLLVEIEECRASSETENKNLLQEKKDLSAALKHTEERLECRQVQWQKEKTLFTGQLSRYKELYKSQTDTLKARIKYEQNKAMHHQVTQDVKCALQTKERGQRPI